MRLFPQRTGTDRKQTILGYLNKKEFLTDETKCPLGQRVFTNLSP